MMTRRDRERVDVQLGSIGKRIGFEIHPDVFDGVEFRSIGRKVFDRDFRVGRKIPGHDSRPVHVEAIPNDNGPPPQVEGDLAEEVPDKRSGDRYPGMDTEEEADPAAMGRDDKGGNYGDFVMASAPLPQDGRLSLGSPGAADQGSHQETAFINEDPGGVQASGFFLSRASPP